MKLKGAKNHGEKNVTHRLTIEVTRSHPALEDISFDSLLEYFDETEIY